MTENIKEKKDEIRLIPIQKESLQIISLDKFTFEQTKNVNNLFDKKNLNFQNSGQFTIQKLIKLLNTIEKRDSVELISIEKEKNEEKNETTSKWITEISETNKLTIERKEAFLNQISANEKNEILRAKKGKNDENKMKRNEEKNEELIGRKNEDKIKIVQTIQKNEVENETEDGDIKMIIKYDGNTVFDSDKVKQDEKKEMAEKNLCDGCIIY